MKDRERDIEATEILNKYPQYKCVHGPEFPGRRGHIKLKSTHSFLGKVYTCTKCRSVLFNIK